MRQGNAAVLPVKFHHSDGADEGGGSQDSEEADSQPEDSWDLVYGFCNEAHESYKSCNHPGSIWTEKNE